jgi:uncharacterized protein DUF6953
MAKYRLYRTAAGATVPLCEVCASRRIDDGESLENLGIQSFQDQTLQVFGQCDDCGHAAHFDTSEGLYTDLYGLNDAMTDVELASPDDVAKRLLSIIHEAGHLTKTDAIRIIWNEFGGRYTYQNPEGTRSIRHDVMRAMKTLGGNSYRFAVNPMRWEMRKPELA